MEQAAQGKTWFGGTALRNDKFHLQENFLLHGTEPACIHHSEQGW